jgi:dethiobiotin synthetase
MQFRTASWRPTKTIPSFLSEPLIPLVAARKHHRSVRLPEVLPRSSRVAGRYECLLIEGIGGVLVPLGEGLAVPDLVARLGCATMVVCHNRLGTINETLLTTGAL